MIIDKGTCTNCEWSGLLTEAIIEYEWDEFHGLDRPYVICPECEGNLEYVHNE